MMKPLLCQFPTKYWQKTTTKHFTNCFVFRKISPISAALHLLFMFGVGLKDFEVRLSWYIWHKSKRLGEISNHGIKFYCSAPLWYQNGPFLVEKKPQKTYFFIQSFLCPLFGEKVDFWISPARSCYYCS